MEEEEEGKESLIEIEKQREEKKRKATDNRFTTHFSLIPVCIPPDEPNTELTM